MADLATFFVKIQSQLDPKGFEATIKKIEEVEKSSESLFAGFTKIGTGLAAAGAAGIGAFALMVNEASKAEQAQAELAQAMRTAGTYTDEALASALEYAQALQNLTGFSDEQIASSQAMLVRFGATGKQLQDLTKSVADFARAQQMDLVSAATLVAKSIGTETNALARYGVEISGSAASTSRMESAVRSLGTLFGGAAQAHAATFAGRIEVLRQQLSDVMEAIGNDVIPIFSGFLRIIQNVINLFNAIPAPIRSTLSVLTLLASGAAALGGALALIIGQIPSIVIGFNQIATAATGAKIAVSGLMLYATLGAAALLALFEVISANIEKGNEQAGADAKALASTQGKIAWYKQEIATIEKKKKLTEEDTATIEKYTKAIDKLTVQEASRAKQMESNLAKEASRRKQIDRDFNDYMDKLKLQAQLADDQKKMEDQMFASRMQNAEGQQQKWIALGSTISSSMSSAFETLIYNGQLTADSLAEFWSNISEGFRRMLAQMLAEMLAKAAIFFLLDVLTQGKFGLIAKLFDNFPKMGFKDGGVALSPQVRSFAETGAELALPLESPRTAQLLARAMDQSTNFGAVSIQINGGMNSRSEAKRMAQIVGDEFINRVKRSRKL